MSIQTRLYRRIIVPVEDGAFEHPLQTEIWHTHFPIQDAIRESV